MISGYRGADGASILDALGDMGATADGTVISAPVRVMDQGVAGTNLWDPGLSRRPLLPLLDDERDDVGGDNRTARAFGCSLNQRRRLSMSDAMNLHVDLCRYCAGIRVTPICTTFT